MFMRSSISLPSRLGAASSTFPSSSFTRRYLSPSSTPTSDPPLAPSSRPSRQSFISISGTLPPLAASTSVASGPFSHLQLTKSSLKSTLASILTELSYPSYDVGLKFVPPKTIRSMNRQYRAKDSETDVLSFPFYDSASSVVASGDGKLVRPSTELLIKSPGVLPLLPTDPSLGDAEDLMNVGDIFVCLKVVEDRMREDEDSSSSKAPPAENVLRGVSARMAGLQSLPARTHLLLVHSVLHLVGYDHETDEDEKIMTAKEEEVIRAIWKL